MPHANSRSSLRIYNLEVLASGLDGRSWVGKPAWGRKVRASQDTVMGNAHRPQGPGKCNRKYTADWLVVSCHRSMMRVGTQIEYRPISDC